MSDLARRGRRLRTKSFVLESRASHSPELLLRRGCRTLQAPIAQDTARDLWRSGVSHGRAEDILWTKGNSCDVCLPWPRLATRSNPWATRAPLARAYNAARSTFRRRSGERTPTLFGHPHLADTTPDAIDRGPSLLNPAEMSSNLASKFGPRTERQIKNAPVQCDFILRA